MYRRKVTAQQGLQYLEGGVFPEPLPAAQLRQASQSLFRPDQAEVGAKAGKHDVLQEGFEPGFSFGLAQEACEVLSRQESPDQPGTEGATFIEVGSWAPEGIAFERLGRNGMDCGHPQVSEVERCPQVQMKLGVAPILEQHAYGW